MQNILLHLFFQHLRKVQLSILCVLIILEVMVAAGWTTPVEHGSGPIQKGGVLLGFGDSKVLHYIGY